MKEIISILRKYVKKIDKSLKTDEQIIEYFENLLENKSDDEIKGIMQEIFEKY